MLQSLTLPQAKVLTQLGLRDDQHLLKLFLLLLLLAVGIASARSAAHSVHEELAQGVG